MIDSCEVKVGDIGDVATDPSYRGKNCMGKLLNFSTEKMRATGIPLSILWGDTNRYRHYGWERFGRDIIFYLSSRSVKELNPGTGFSIRGYDRTKKDLDKIIKIHEKEPLRIARSRKDYERILNKPYVQVWLGEDNGASAYVILRDNEAVELGGETLTILKMLSFILNNCPIDKLKLHLPFRESELLNEMYKISAGWELACLGMLKIIDLQNLLAAFKNELQKKAEFSGLENGRGISLQMEGARQTSSLIMKDKLEIVNGQICSDMISLSETEMVHLIFGWHPERFGKSIEQRKFLKAIFPLDFYIWCLDKV